MNHKTIVLDGVFFQINDSGIARYWTDLLRELSKDEAFCSGLFVIDRVGTCPRFPNIQYLAADLFSYDTVAEDRKQMQKLCDSVGADYFVSTYYTLPETTPSTFYAYDMIPERMGFDLTEPMWRSKLAAIKHADRFIAISRSTARDLTKYYNVTQSGVSVVYPAASAQFKPSGNLPEQFGPPVKYVLLSAPDFGYKNGEVVIEALKLLDFKLDILATGRKDSRFLKAARAALPNTSFYSAKFSETELTAAYASAMCLVYPSKYEGFGLPPLEAMSVGCPVVTCYNSSLPEVCGDAAMYFDPDSPQALADALKLLYESPEARDKLSTLGLEQASKFTWADSAQSFRSAFK